MATDKPAPVPTELYAIEVHDAGSDAICHVIAHPIRATSPGTAVWEALRAYPFRIRHWRLQAVPAQQYFQDQESAA